MPRKGYDEATKSAFMQAVTAARAAGKPWVDAFKAAKGAGYTGTLGGIEKMFHLMKGVRKPGAKRGRPKGLGVARKHRHVYDEATRAAIVNATLEAQKAGKKWPEALQAAKTAGYQGGLIALTGFVTRTGKPARKPGMPAKKAQVAGGLEPIQEIIERLVKEQVKVAIGRAIAELEKARG
ncbi:MAG: hypothetical protein ABSE73_02100 [Planctomycetota bacterium]